MSSRRVMLTAMTIAAILLPLVAVLPASPNASAYSGIVVTIDGPTFGGINETIHYVMTITGGPAENGGNFSYGATIVGTNTTGASVDPSSAPSQSSGVFKFNVTMPVFAPETITLRINATSQNPTNTIADTLQKDFKIKVVVPILLKATLVNKGAVPASNVTAKFFADSVLLHSEIVNITANGTQVLSYNWTFLKLSTGKHIITIAVDDPNKIVEFSDGNNVITREIWYGKQSNIPGAVLTGGVIFLAVMVFLMWLQKPMRKPKK